MMNRLAALTLLAALSSTALAQPATPAAEQPAPTQRSEDVAVMITLGAVGVSYGMIAAGHSIYTETGDSEYGPYEIDNGSRLGHGLEKVGAIAFVLTPSLGHFYGTGNPITLGLVARVAGAGLLLSPHHAEHNDMPGEDGDGFGLKIATEDVLGLALLGGGVIYDLATVGRATRRANAKRELRTMPTLAPATRGTGATVGLAGTF